MGAALLGLPRRGLCLALGWMFPGALHAQRQLCTPKAPKHPRNLACGQSRAEETMSCLPGLYKSPETWTGFDLPADTQQSLGGTRPADRGSPGVQMVVWAVYLLWGPPAFRTIPTQQPCLSFLSSLKSKSELSSPASLALCLSLGSIPPTPTLLKI